MPSRRFNAMKAVRQFHVRFGLPASDTPRLLPCHTEQARAFAERVFELSRAASSAGVDGSDLLLSRAALALEELAEWLSAHARGDLVAAADAWADRAYILFGDAVAAGLPAADLFTTVHASNMTKTLDPSGGKPAKGEGYQPPDIRAVLQKHRLERDP